MKLDLPMPVVAKTPMWLESDSDGSETVTPSRTPRPARICPTSRSPMDRFRNSRSASSGRETTEKFVGAVIGGRNRPSWSTRPSGWRVTHRVIPADSAPGGVSCVMSVTLAKKVKPLSGSTSLRMSPTKRTAVVGTTIR